MDNVKTVYPPTNTVCGGYNDTDISLSLLLQRSYGAHQSLLSLIKSNQGYVYSPWVDPDDGVTGTL